MTEKIKKKLEGGEKNERVRKRVIVAQESERVYVCGRVHYGSVCVREGECKGEKIEKK